MLLEIIVFFSKKIFKINLDIKYRFKLGIFYFKAVQVYVFRLYQNFDAFPK